MKIEEYNGLARQLIWANSLPKNCPAREMAPDSPDCSSWAREFQEKHGLKADGMLGPATLLGCISELEGDLGGIGGAIVGGKEVEVRGTRVAKLFNPKDPTKVLDEPPKLAILLSIAELHRSSRQRLHKPAAARCHFSIDSSRGKDGASLIIQWADPMSAVPFSPSERLQDYPPGRHVIGIEIENPLAIHYREREYRSLLRQREVITSDIGGRSIRQLNFFPEQIQALANLLKTLHESMGLSLEFPREPSKDFNISCDPGRWSSWEGVMAKFHISSRYFEPGIGLISYLPKLFGEAPKQAQKTSKQDAFVPSFIRRPAPRRAFVPEIPDEITEAERAHLKAAWASPSAGAVRSHSRIHEIFSIHQALQQAQNIYEEDDREAQASSLRSRVQKLARYPTPPSKG